MVSSVIAAIDLVPLTCLFYALPSPTVATPTHTSVTGHAVTQPQLEGIDVRSQLRQFHDKYYSSNLMNLCILGQQPLDELEAFARARCKEVPNRHTASPSTAWLGKTSAVKSQSCAKLVRIVPVAESRKVVVSWPVSLLTEKDRQNLMQVSSVFA